MDPDAVKNETSGHAATHNDPVSGSGVLEDALTLWNELRGLTLGRFRLAALETQQAGNSLVIMIMAGVIVAVLLGSAWLGLVAAAVLWLVENNIIVASSAILLAVALNLLLALIFCGVIRHKSRNLQFPATLRTLQPISPKRRDTEKS